MYTGSLEVTTISQVLKLACLLNTATLFMVYFKGRQYQHIVRSNELATVFCLEYFKGQSDPCAKDKPETITNLVECCGPS